MTHELEGIDDKDPVAQLLVEQTLNMLAQDVGDRLDARGIKHRLRVEESLFCASRL